MNKQRLRICIVGGGFGGLYTALALSNSTMVKQGKCEVVLVEPKDNFLFTPLLYEVLTEELHRSEIYPSYGKLLRKTGIELCQQKVVGVDLQSYQVDLESGEKLNYDYLVLAVGNQNRSLRIKGADHALNFRTMEDAELLDERLKLLERSQRQCLRIAVVGGGPSGVELACKLSDRLQTRAEVVIIDRSTELLKPFSPGIKKASAKALKTRNIKVIYQSELESITNETITLKTQDQPSTIPCDLVLWTAGTQPKDWIVDLKVQQTLAGKLITKPTMQLIDHGAVFALGDIAQISYNKPTNLPATAQVAYQQASKLAKNLEAIVQGQKLQPFYYLHLGDMLTLGKRSAVVSSFGINIEGFLGDKMRRLVYIQRLPTWRHRLGVLRNVAKRSFVRRKRMLSWKLQRLFNSKATNVQFK